MDFEGLLGGGRRWRGDIGGKYASVCVELLEKEVPGDWAMGDCEGSTKRSSSSVVDCEPGIGSRELVLEMRFSPLLVGEELSYGARLDRTGDAGDGGVLWITGAITLPVLRRAVFRNEPFRFRVFACCIMAAIAPPAFPLTGLEGSSGPDFRSALDALFPLLYPFSIMPSALNTAIVCVSRMASLRRWVFEPPSRLCSDVFHGKSLWSIGPSKR